MCRTARHRLIDTTDQIGAVVVQLASPLIIGIIKRRHAVGIRSTTVRPVRIVEPIGVPTDHRIGCRIQGAAREFLASRLNSDKLRDASASDDAFDGRFWQEMSELNWPGLLVSEDHGNAGKKVGSRNGYEGIA